jgi:DNA-binding CsgD family transcriptional regulator
VHLLACVRTRRLFIYGDRTRAPLSPEEHALARDDAHRAWRVLTQELTAEERLVLVRRGVEGRAPAEIAAELGISARRYRRLLERAGHKLTEGIRVSGADQRSVSMPPADETRDRAQPGAAGSGRPPEGERALANNGPSTTERGSDAAANTELPRRAGDPGLWLAA